MADGMIADALDPMQRSPGRALDKSGDVMGWGVSIHLPDTSLDLKERVSRQLTDS